MHKLHLAEITKKVKKESVTEILLLFYTAQVVIKLKVI